MRQGIALMLVGAVLIITSGLGNVLTTQHIQEQLTACDNQADQEYQKELASNPYPPGSTQSDQYIQTVTVEYEEATSICQDDYGTNSASTASYGGLELIGILVLGFGIYYWYRARPKQPAASPLPSGTGTVWPPSTSPPTGVNK